MSKIGDKLKGIDIGKSDKTHWFIYSACEICGLTRWVREDYLIKKKSILCLKCKNKFDSNLIRKNKPRLKGGKRGTHTLLLGSNSPTWKGGRRKDRKGYIQVWLPNDSPFTLMRSNRRYIPEHRLIMAQKLNRCLEKWELVHHKDGIKDHNTIDNLELVSDSTHKQINALIARVAELEALLIK